MKKVTYCIAIMFSLVTVIFYICFWLFGWNYTDWQYWAFEAPIFFLIGYNADNIYNYIRRRLSQ